MKVQLMNQSKYVLDSSLVNVHVIVVH